MNTEELNKLRYPIGRFQLPETISRVKLNEWITILDEFPVKLASLINGLTDEQLDTVYRPEGWTVRQVVHHVSDSHHHSYIRFKWALTEDRPMIKAYFEDRWAELQDSRHAPVQMSLDHLKAVHFKLVYLLRTLSDEDLERSFIHPETNFETSIKENIGRYAWHSEHHYMHIKNLLKRNGWL